MQRYRGVMRDQRSTWALGGICLILCGLLGTVSTSYSASITGKLLAALTAGLFAVSMLVFAVGRSAHASIVARKPLGVVSLLLLAAFQMVGVIVDSAATAAGNQMFQAPEIFLYAMIFASTATALVAGMQIVRAGVVASPWCWAPLVVLLVQAVIWIVTQAGYSQLVYIPVAAADTLSLLGVLAWLLGTIGLGTVALFLSSRAYSPTVQVFGSASSKDTGHAPRR